MLSPISQSIYYNSYNRIQIPINRSYVPISQTFKGNDSDSFESSQTKSELSETQKWGIATIAAVGIAVVADFALAKGKHVKSILGIAEKEGANVKPKPSGTTTPNPTGTPNPMPKPNPTDIPNPTSKPHEIPDVKSPESVPDTLSNNSGHISEEPVIPQENHILNDSVPPESKPVEQSISHNNNSGQPPVEQPEPRPTGDRIPPNTDNIHKKLDRIRNKHRQQQEQRFASVRETITEKIQANVKDKNGNTINTEISAIQGNHGDYRREISVNGRVIGASENLIYSDGAYIATLPESYQNGQSALEIKFLGTTSNYNGAGTELIKAAIQDSINAGYEGRVFVNACGGSLPPDFGFIGAGKYGSSPVPFYYKQGFRFYDEELNKQVLSGLKEVAKTGIYPKSAPQTGIMYLP